MYICDSKLVVAGISSIVSGEEETPEVRAQTLEAIRQINSRVGQIPKEKLDRAYMEVAHHRHVSHYYP